MDVQTYLAGAKRRLQADSRETSEWDCRSLPRLKKLNEMSSAQEIATVDSSSEENVADDALSYISELLHDQEFTVHNNCDFSDVNMKIYDESMSDFLTSLLKESETEKVPDVSVAVPEIRKPAVEGENLKILQGEERNIGSKSLYSGPTLTDVRSALSIYNNEDLINGSSSSTTTSVSMLNSAYAKPPPRPQQWQLPTSGLKIEQLDAFSHSSYRNFSSSINDLFYRRLHRSKTESKYSLKIKCPGNPIDDGYKWRKYGQKAIKNSPYPRSYYRCTNPRCCAKKQVERSVEDPETITITYEGLHLHYSYSQLQISQPLASSILPHPPPNCIYDKESTRNDAMQASDSPTMVAVHQPQDDNNILFGGGGGGGGGDGDGDGIMDIGVVEEFGVGGGRGEGLLQDIVPVGIINPLSSSSTSSSSSSSSSP